MATVIGRIVTATSSSLFIALAYAQVQPQQPISGSAPLMAVAKNVIREAAKIGLDEAGARILGPTAWKPFKQILMPVVEELERRYPALFLKGTSQAKAAAEHAIVALDHDVKLQRQLTEGFRKLEEGQAAIVAELNRINDVLRANGMAINEMKVLLETTLRRVEDLRSQAASRQPMEADRRAGESPARRLANSVTQLGIFINQIVRQGQPDTAYSRILDSLLPVAKDIPESEIESQPWLFGPTEYVVTVSQPFNSEGGLYCRRAGIEYFSEGHWKRWGDQVHCRMWDRWQRMFNWPGTS